MPTTQIAEPTTAPAVPVATIPSQEWIAPKTQTTVPESVGVQPSQESELEDESASTIEKIEILRGRIELLIFSSAKERQAMKSARIPVNAKLATGRAAEEIWKHLKARGRVFNADGVGYLLLYAHPEQPIRIAPDEPLFENLLYEYGLFSATDYFKVIGKFIGVRATIEGEPATIAFNARYNPTTKAVYFAEGNGVLLKVDANDIRRVQNGEDGMLFKFADGSQSLDVELDALPELGYSLLADDDSYLTRYLFGGLVFDNSTTMTPEQKRILLVAHALLLILPGIIGKEKTLLQLLGPSGCGKSFFFKKLGRIIVGDSFEVQRMPEDPKEFENILINNDIAFLDNVTKVNTVVKSLICQAVTGFAIERRELFTTAGRIKVPSKASLGVSAITSVLDESEQANRSITIELERRGTANRAEQDMLEELDRHRNELVGELLVRTQMVLQAMEAQQSYAPTVRNRLAGVSTFILRIAKHEGWLEDAKKLLAAWNTDQLQSAVGDDDLSGCLFYWITEPNWKSSTLPADQLFIELQAVAKQRGYPELKGARSVSVMLRRSIDSFEDRFGLRVGKDSHTKNSTFTFEPSDVVLAGLRASRAVVDSTAVQTENNCGANSTSSVGI